MKRLYSSLLTRGASPALVWYSPRGRIELSGSVLARHLAKDAAFLEAECEARRGAGVVVDLPVDWKMVTWALGALLAGAPLAFFDAKAGSQLLAPRGSELTALDHEALPWGGILFSNKSASYLHRAASESGAMPNYPEGLLNSWPSLVSVDLAPLALQWMGDPLHTSILDGNAESMGYPDSYSPTTQLDTADTPGGAHSWEEFGGALTATSKTSPAGEAPICLDFTTSDLAEGAMSAACFAICLHYIRYGCVVVATDGKAEDKAVRERAQLIELPSLCPEA